jgi:hypothetical protein
MAMEGERVGIKANALAPQASTRKHPYLMGLEDGAAPPTMLGSVDQVAPVVAYLCHQSCQANGRVVWAGSGTAREFRYYESAGYHDPQLTIEDVRDNFDRVLEQTGAQPIEPLDPAILDRVPRRPYAPR